jgi:hypothetical protein
MPKITIRSEDPDDKEITEFHKLFSDMSALMEGHSDDDLIPAMCTLIALVGAESGATKRSLLAYFAGVLDKIYTDYGNASRH